MSVAPGAGPGKASAVDGLAKIRRDELVRWTRGDFERTMREVADAVNDAPDEPLIDGSEERARDLPGEFPAYPEAAFHPSRVRPDWLRDLCAPESLSLPSVAPARVTMVPDPNR